MADTLAQALIEAQAQQAMNNGRMIDDEIIIDADTRVIGMPETEILFGVESDEKTERKYFRCPRYVGDNIDLLNFGIQINYRNANGEEDIYVVSDKKEDAGAGDIIFSWLLSRKVTRYKGQVTYIICATSLRDGKVTNEWNTTLAHGNVLEGLEVNDILIEEPEIDVLRQLMQLTEENSSKALQALQTANNTLSEVQDASTEVNTLKGQLQGLITQAQDVLEKLEGIGEAAKITYQVVTSIADLPETGQNGVIYLVPPATRSVSNVYVEYLWIENENRYEPIGELPKADIVVDSTLDNTSINPIQNKAVADAVEALQVDIGRITPDSIGAVALENVDTALSTTSANPIQNKAVANNTWMLSGGTAIPANADLNDYTEIGNYYCSSSTITETLINCPINTAFILKVCDNIGSSGKVWRRQEIIGSTYNHYIRRILKSSGVFSPYEEWKALDLPLINNLTTTEAGKGALDAKQGYLLNPLNSFVSNSDIVSHVKNLISLGKWFGAFLTAGSTGLPDGVSGGDICYLLVEGTNYVHLRCGDTNGNNYTGIFHLVNSTVPTWKKIAYTDNTKSLTQFTEIPSGADLKSAAYLVPGNYCCITNAFAQSLLNCPIKKAFAMEVSIPIGLTSEFRKQTIFAFDGSERYERTKNMVNGIWYDDYKYTGEKDITFTELTNSKNHRNIFRGKNLGTSVTNAQKTAIQNGSFEDLYVGDYWTINGVVYRIADFDYWYNSGDTAFTKHHLVIVPDSALYNAKMNDTNTTEGGYAGSKMRTANLAQAKTTISNAFGAMLLTHREYLTNAVTSGIPSGGDWYDSDVELMNEIMVYGCQIYTSVLSDGTTIPNKYTIDKSQLALMRLATSFQIPARYSYWLRDVVKASSFACSAYYGPALYLDASSSIGVRPVFAIGV